MRLTGGTMRLLVGFMIVLLWIVPSAYAQTWVEVGADTEAKFYVDLDSISFVKDVLRLTKRGVYTHVLTENLGGKPTVFKETRGIVELDCELRVNRVIRIDMLDQYGKVVWSSGDMPRQMWLSVKPNSHAETTLEVACERFHRT
jgi:hypothetical protein